MSGRVLKPYQIIMRQVRGSEATEAVFCLESKKPLHTGVRTGCHYLISLSVCLSVSVCVTFVVSIDCENCTRPISTNPGSMEVGEYGLTRGTSFVARRLEAVAVAGLLWISWCVRVRRDFVGVFPICLFRTHTA